MMHDIGLNNLFAGGRALLCIPAGMAAGYGVALAFGLPALVGVMLGALPAFLSCFVVVDRSAARVALRSAFLYVPFVIALFLSVALREFRVLELVIIVGLLFVHFYAPRFGPWVGDFGGGLFAAYLCGLLLPFPLTSFPAMALVFAGSLAATIGVRSLVFHPNAYRSLIRTSRAFVGWQTAVLETSVDVLEGDHRALRTLRRRRQRAHEAALISEGFLGTAGAGPTGATAEKLQVLLFESEQAVDGLARIAAELLTNGAPGEVRDAVSASLRVVLDHGGQRGVAAARDLLAWSGDSRAVASDHRWQDAVNRTILLLSDVADSSSDWLAIRRELPRTGDGVPFKTPVVLTDGRPIGAESILKEEIASGGISGARRRIRISPALRTAIQAAVAVAVVEPLAYLLDGERFYWGVIGVMVILAGTNSTHDRLRKLGSRGVGTAIGGVIGIALVDLLGTDHVWLSLALVIVALAAGMYGFSRSYVFWVIGLVVALCQVYLYSAQFSDTLILFRLIENLMGAVVALGVSIVILPVTTTAMIRRASIGQLATVRAFVDEVGARGSGSRLRNASRAVDQATFQLESVFKPLVRFRTGGGYRKDDDTRTVLVGVARTARGIAYSGGTRISLSNDIAAEVKAITKRLSASIDALASAIGGAKGLVWTGTSALIGQLDNGLPAGDVSSSVLHGLARIDAALADLAGRYDVTVVAEEPLDLTTRQTKLSAARVRERFRAEPPQD